MWSQTASAITSLGLSFVRPVLHSGPSKPQAI